MVGYYAACAVLWALLAALWVASRQEGFPAWLEAHPKAMLALLGVSQLPKNALRTLRRFYFYLSGGWTWILVWSWWLGPWVKVYFFRSVTTSKGYDIARMSTMIVIASYAAAGFYAIGRGITIWFKEIYLGIEKPAKRFRR
jgi:hypothetical protein